MRLPEHEKGCLEMFGRPWTEVHEFLDSYQKKYRGHAHRRILHHEIGVRLCREKFGEEAGEAARLHIRQDLGRVPRSWKELEENYFPLGNEEAQQEIDLVELYGHETYTEIENEG